MHRVRAAPSPRLPPDPVARSRYLPGSEVLALLRSGSDGLDPAEAAQRLSLHGPNALALQPPVPAWRLLLGQFQSVVVLLLVVAMGVSGLFGEFLEAMAIGGVLVLNAGIGFFTEYRAHRAMEALVEIGRGEATVVRSGDAHRIPTDQVVPGDIVLLEPGEAIPADGRLLQTTEFQVNESALTGESVPVSKSTGPLPESDPPEAVADRTNSVFKGTLVATGQATAVVTVTGDATEIGRVSQLAQAGDEGRTPLERQLNRLGRRLVWVTLLAAGLVMWVGWARGVHWVEMLETALALAIAAVPEGLPAVATITLALGMRRMAVRKALVRRLPAVETLGSCTVICTDKTGTLTEGSMTAVLFALPSGDVAVSGSGLSPEGGFTGEEGPIDPHGRRDLAVALLCGLLASRARVVEGEEGWVVEGDPTEGALVVAARKAGWERDALLSAAPVAGELPFSSERKFMAALHRLEGGGGVILAKGAPDRLLGLCDEVLQWTADHSDSAARSIGTAGIAVSLLGSPAKGGAAVRVPLAQQERSAWLEKAEAMGRAGLRVLALAMRSDVDPDEPLADDLGGLCLVGLVGMQDPADEGVQPTIRSLKEAGVRTVMITGDQHATAISVADSVGILETWEEAVTGAELSAFSPEDLLERCATVGVYSRVDPEGKLRIVEALRSRGEIVGMLGDGVNDAAALRAADVGVAMGIRGTDVARETSDLVLLDDRFETVVAAVEEGRVIFDNIRKFIYYLFSCNLSEVLVLLTAGLAGWPLPLLPLQILWLNLLTDVLPALTLAGEPGEPGIMERPPRDPTGAILSLRFLGSVSASALLLTASTLGVFLVGLRMEGALPGVAVTMAFSTLAFTQLAHAFNARSRDPVLFSSRLFSNGWVLLAVGLAGALQVAAVHVPQAQEVLHTVALQPSQWGWVAGGSLVPLLVGQLIRLVPQKGLPISLNRRPPDRSR